MTTIERKLLIMLSNLRGDKKQTFVGVLEPGYMQLTSRRTRLHFKCTIRAVIRTLFRRQRCNS